MIPDFDRCRDNLADLVAWYAEREATRNEATTRLHLIDALLVECLGWRREDITAEDVENGDRTDYVLSTGRRVLVVEAKREGTYFDLPGSMTKPHYALRGLCDNSGDLQAAIKQVIKYANGRGIPYAAVTNGHQLVTFVATRSDGCGPLEGHAAAFTSLANMRERFTEFTDLLSKPGVEDNRILYALTGRRPPTAPPKLAASLDTYPGTQQRNIFQANLQIVGDLVLEDVTRNPDLEPVFLRECYCASGALSQYALISKKILQSRYAALFSADQPGPATVDRLSSEMLAKSYSRRPILLLGDIGVGKTMFLRHFIRIDSEGVFERAVFLYFDFGSAAALSRDIRRSIIDELETQLRDRYELDVDDNSIIRGVYNLDLLRFGKGLHAPLKTLDPPAYAQKEISFLETLVNDREKHLARVLGHLEKGQLKQIVFFIDNVDQRSDAEQQQAFLIAQELADRWPVAVFLTLRPETFYRSQRTGALSGYHPKAFTVSPPRMDRVLQSRLDFALKLTSGEIPVHSLGVGIETDLASLDAVLRILRNSIRVNEALVECIDNIASGNIRRGLDLVRGFLGSGHVDTEKIVVTYQATGSYTIPLHEFLRAVIYGENLHYNAASSSVVNLFDISTMDCREHFLLPSLLGLLMRPTDDESHGFIASDEIYERLQGCRFTPEQIDFAIARACRKNLIEVRGGQFVGSGELSHGRARITSLGAYHCERLCEFFTYLDAMVVDTPVVESAVRADLRNEVGIARRLQRCETFLKYLDASYTHYAASDNGFFDWPSKAQRVRTDIVQIRERIGQ